MSKKKPVVIDGKFVPVPDKEEEKQPEQQPEIEIPLPPPRQPPAPVNPEDEQRGPVIIDMNDGPNIDGDDVGEPLFPDSGGKKKKRKKNRKKKG
jgi:hypothetical protein